MKQKLFTFLLAILASVIMANAEVYSGTCGAEGDNLTWELDTETGVLSISGTGAMADFIIKQVTLATDAPWYLKRYSIVIINEGVTSIGANAFRDSGELTSIDIPNSVTSIGDGAFSLCSALTSLIIATDNPNYSSEDGVLFDKNKTTILQYPKGRQGSYSIPNSVTSIGSDVFSGCTGLTSIEIPNSVTSIGDWTFMNCSSLTSIEIPNSVTSIGSDAFSGCTGLTSIEIPNSVTSIGDWTFMNCSSLTSVTIGNSVTSIGNQVFVNCNSLTSIVVESGNQKYDSRNNCNAIIKTATNILIFGCKNTIIPNSVTSIGKHAFCNCSALTSIDIPNSVTSIGEESFTNCIGLTSIDIPNSVTSIGKYAFSGCTGLTSIEIPNSVTNMGEGAFYDCSSLPIIDNIRYADTYLVEAVDKSLSSYTIKEGTRWVGDAAFWECGNLTSIEIPNSVTSIGDDAFGDCIGLTSVTIPNSVISIESNAFRECTSLTSIEIPISITSIGSMAFYDCTSLTSITCNAITPPTLGSRAFKGVNKSIPLYVPAESIAAYQATYIGDRLNGWKDFTNIQAISGTEVPTCPFTGTCGAEGDNLIWELSCDGVLTISGTGAMSDYDYCGCPGSTNNAPWYEYRESILSVIIENGVSNIGQAAFAWCSNVTSIDIPTSVTSISNDAFVGCSKLTSAPIGEGVVTIEWNAYEACEGITSVTIPASVHTIGDWAFVHCGYSWGCICGDDPIPGDALAPKRAKKEESCADITIITSYATTPPTLGQNVFYGTDLSIPVYVPGSSIEAYQAADGWKVFTNIQAIPGTEVPTCPFTGTCGAEGDNLTWELSCDGVLTISGTGEMAYYTSSSAVPWSSYRSSITSVVIYDGVIRIGDYAFSNCTSLTSIDIPNSVTSIGYNAFRECSGLTSIDIPNSVTSIGASAFTYCSGLTSVTIPNSVTSIGGGAFSLCEFLTFIELSNSVISIGRSAFTYCSGLTSIEIPNSVTSIGEDAFSNCYSLMSITCNADTPPTLGSRVFKGVNKSIPLYVPAESIEAYQEAEGWKDFTNIQPICQSLSYSAISMDETKGSVEIVNEQKTCESIEVTLRAVPKPGYMFTMWNDGREEAERTVTITENDNNGYTFIACFYNNISFTDLSVIETTPYTITVAAHTNLPDMEAGPDDNPSGAGFELEYTNGESGGGFITQCAVQDGYMTATIDLHHSWASSALAQYPFDEVYWRPYFTSEAEWNETLGTWHNEHIVGESVEIPEWKKGYELPMEPVVIGDGDDEDLEDILGGNPEIVVEPGGALNVNMLDVRVGVITIISAGNQSGQVHGANNLNGWRLFMEYVLNPFGSTASPNLWYAFAVPFEVDIETGITRAYGKKSHVSGEDFLIMEYNGQKRADSGKGWEQKLSGTLEPGHFYMIGIEGNCNRWLFEKKSDAAVSGNNHMNVNSYIAGNSDNAKHNGWNGMGNTQLEYSTMDLSGLGIEYLLTYNNQRGKYDIVSVSDASLCVGQPFFIQASADGAFDFVHNSGHHMSALYAQRDAKPLMHFTLTDENQSTGTDHMYLTMHEDAVPSYTIGRDVARMSTTCTTAAQLWTTMADGTQLSAHGIELPATSTTVGLELFAPAAGEYRFAMDTRDMDGYEVELLYNGTWVATLDAQPVTLELNAGTNSGYALRITRQNMPTEVGNVQGDKVQGTKVLIEQHLYILQGEHMYDAQGKQVK